MTPSSALLDRESRKQEKNDLPAKADAQEIELASALRNKSERLKTDVLRSHEVCRGSHPKGNGGR